MLKAVLGLLCAVGLSTSAANLAAQQMSDQPIFQDGGPLPEISFPNINGSGDVDLADFRGKKLLLIQFASW